MDYHTKSKKSYKVIVSILLFLIVALIPGTTFSQDVKMQLEVQVESPKSISSNDGQITIDVKGRNGNCSFYLYDNLPHLTNGELQKSEFIAQDTYVFSNLTVGDYYVCVYDEDYRGPCKKVKIEN